MITSKECPKGWRAIELPQGCIGFRRKDRYRHLYGFICIVVSICLFADCRGEHVPATGSETARVEFWISYLAIFFFLCVGAYLLLGRKQMNVSKKGVEVITGIPFLVQRVSCSWQEIEDIRMERCEKGYSLYESAEDGHHGLTDQADRSNDGIDSQGVMLTICLTDKRKVELDLHSEPEAEFFVGYLTEWQNGVDKK